MGLSKKEFSSIINEKILTMKGNYIELYSGDIHRELGGYPGRNHSMPTCCEAMRDLMIPGDEIIESPPKGNGATLKIRYYKRV
jgi:5-methylcytosine-specific restriction protein A